MNREQSERKICAAICQSNGLKAKDIARQVNLDRSTVNRVLYASPLLKDLCYQDDSYRWHGIIRQSVPHDGFRNEVFHTLDKVVERLCKSICSLSADTIKSVTCRKWIVSTFN